jgi:hypothetical protein
MNSSSQALIETIRQRPVKGFGASVLISPSCYSTSPKLSVKFLHQFSPSPFNGFQAGCEFPGFGVEVGQLLLELLRFIRLMRAERYVLPRA